MHPGHPSRLSAVLLCAAALLGITPAGTAQVLQDRARYTIQPGDQLEIHFRLTPEFNQTVSVQPDGFVILPVAGDVRVVSLTVHQAEAQIAAGMASRLKDPEVTISLLSFQKPYFVVAGQVNHPGRFEMHEDTTAMQAVLLAGGPTDKGRLSQVVVFRHVSGSGAQVKLLDLNNLKKSTDLERDLQLQSGDMLLVPRNRLSKLEEITRLGANMGVYVNPLQAVTF